MLIRRPNIITIFLILISGIILTSAALANDPKSRTEKVCSIGMVKGDTGRTCNVPIPSGCTVANYPGYDDPWAEVDKGGRISCKFDDQKTDWKTNITGTCGKCTTEQCTARFTVKFNCQENMAPSIPQNLRNR